MKQYWEVKSTHPDKIVFFRMGDFFELFHDDAVTAAPILDIVLTSRNKKAEDETPMCGVPHHSIGGHINRLLSRGYKVAICDQIEDPKLAKGLVKRAITRIMSPGMVYDSDTLDAQKPNYLCSWDENSIAFLEPTTGEAFFYRTEDVPSQERLLRLLAPVEVILADTAETPKGEWHLTTFSEMSGPEAWPASARRLLAYAKSMQGAEIEKTLCPFEERALQVRLRLSPTVHRHLEVFETYKGEHNGSLFWAMDRTKTSAGARLLRQWLQMPLTSRKEILARQDQVAGWLARVSDLEAVRNVLGRMGDIQRRLGKISNPNCTPRDLQSLAQSLQTGVEASIYLPENQRHPELHAAAELSAQVLMTLVEEPPATKREGQMIRKGYSPELDELIQLSSDSQSRLLEMEAREKEATGISSLKIRYNNVFGYYIEITNTHKSRVPAHYMRKQTLVNAERYITEDLQELERKVLSARTRRDELELEIFEDLRRSVLAATRRINDLGHSWAELDVLTALAWLAREANYVRPQMLEQGTQMRLISGRHPVLDQVLKGRFVPNSIEMKSGEVMLLTGPNMAGKSTLMRQAALISIMAQMGSYVPAKEAALPVFEQIFTRIGAADALTEGLSTFMVEMKETAEILENLCPKSLVVLDEIGRGTSTFDGMSLARALLEHFAKTKCMTLFATHYHELTDLEVEFPQIKNAHMAIREKGGEIYFLYMLTPGPASRSYGIDVAKQAGLPPELISRAKTVLAQLEKGGAPAPQLSLFASPQERSSESRHPLFSEIEKLDLDRLTPVEALVKLSEIKKELLN